MRTHVGLVTLLWLAPTIVSSWPQSLADKQEEIPMADMSIEQVLQVHTSGLMAISGVVGTAQGLCDWEPCIRVFVVDSSARMAIGTGS